MPIDFGGERWIARFQSRPEFDRITASHLKEMVFTNSIQPTEDFEASPKLRWISIAPLIGEAISRTASEQSVSSLFI